MIKFNFTLLCIIPVLAFGQVQVTGSTVYSTENILLPKGFKIEVYAKGIINAREMDIAEDGTLFAGSSTAGKVYAIRPDRSVIIIDDGLNNPAGLDYYKGDLYIAEVSRILKYGNIMQKLDGSPKPVVVNGNFPKDTINGLKFIRVGPDGMLYIPVGMPCNVCLPDKTWYGRIFRMSLDGNLIEEFADGVRNAGGFDWDPVLQLFWFTDNGRNDMGKDVPEDELNKAIVTGQHFGFPYFNAGIPDPAFSVQRPKGAVFTNASKKLDAHSAPLGMRFYTGKMFDESYQGGIFIAEHGSSEGKYNSGCRISFIPMEENRAVGYQVFASGWLQNGNAWGRPADVQVGNDGSLFVSDELAGCIYRIYK
jgi:glucose/arabinose dehydrogenase